MNEEYLDKITRGDCRDHISRLADNSIELFLSDIPYGISLDDWDVLHDNTNLALLGQSPAQAGKSAFKRRVKPINGWSQADRNIGREYQQWCQSWTERLLPKMKCGASLFVFGAPAPYTASSMLLKTAVSFSRTCSLGRKSRRTIERKE